MHGQCVLRGSGQLLAVLEVCCSQRSTWHGVVRQDVEQRGLVCVQVGDLDLQLQQRSPERLQKIQQKEGGLGMPCMWCV
jgi:hypothetical protein